MAWAAAPFATTASIGEASGPVQQTKLLHDDHQQVKSYTAAECPVVDAALPLGSVPSLLAALATSS
jgi:hypothetical protein